MTEKPNWWDTTKEFHPWIIVDRLADIILYYVGGCVVEIGLGKSTYILAKHAKKAGVKHYGVDTSEKKCIRLKHRLAEFEDHLTIYNQRSLDFIETFDDVPGLVFIDGCHKASVVMKEAMFFLDRLLPGGVIFFHDMFICEAWAERYAERRKFTDTYRVRWELENLKNVWCFTFPYTAVACGLTMVMKRPVYEYAADPLDILGRSINKGDWERKSQLL